MTIMMDRASPDSPGTDITLQYGVFTLVSFFAGGFAAVGLAAAAIANICYRETP